MIEQLGNLCDFLNGGTPSKDKPHYFEGDIPWITSADITGPVAKSARSFITEEAIYQSSTNKVSKGTVLLVTRTGVGKVAIAGQDLCFSQDITAIKPDSKKLLTGYLVHFLRTKQEHFSRLARGATIKGITREVIEQLEVPLPPLPEQHRIAAILDQADALRAKRREALAQLDSLTQSTFIDTFGDPVTNQKGWATHQLASLSERIQIGPFGSQLHEEDYINGGVPLINPTHIREGKICPDASLTVPESKYQQLGQYHLSAGDLIIGRRGEMGRCAVITEAEQGWLCGTGSLFVRPDFSRIHPIYLRHVISSNSMRKHLENVAQGVTMANLNKEIVGALSIPTPPLQLQQAYVNQLIRVESLSALQIDALNETHSLFASLQYRAFHGEL